MTIKDMPHVTVEQVLELRKAAIKLEDRVLELRAENVELLNIVNQFVDSKVVFPESWGIGYSAFDEAYKRAMKLRGEK